MFCKNLQQFLFAESCIILRPCMNFKGYLFSAEYEGFKWNVIFID
jgi:hypothetical protein